LGVKTPVQGGETGDDSHHLYAQIGQIEKSSIVQNKFIDRNIGRNEK
jgi:hypothetical protein